MNQKNKLSRKQPTLEPPNKRSPGSSMRATLPRRFNQNMGKKVKNDRMSPPPPPPPSPSLAESVNITVRNELSAVDVQRVCNDLGKYMKSRRASLEKDMFDKFYRMRLVQSRKFIDLMERIDRSCNNFMEMMRLLNQSAYGDGDHDPTAYSLPSNGSVIPQDEGDSHSDVDEDRTISCQFSNAEFGQEEDAFSL